MRPDLKVSCHGTVWLFLPQNDGCRDWLEAHTDGMWFGGALVVEPRYVDGLAGGLAKAGFRFGDFNVQKRKFPQVRT